MKRWRLGLGVAVSAVVAACASGNATTEPPQGPKLEPIPEPIVKPPTFEDDVAFLEKHGAVETLVRGGARIALSAKYQGRVMTSAVAPGGASLGFVHRKFIDKGATGTAFDNYGGEDRLWLGPEGGQYGLFFAPGKPFTFEAWQTPHDMQEGEWAIDAKTVDSVTFHHPMHLVNWSGTAFDVDVVRTVKLLDGNAVTARLRVPLDPSVAWVAFESANRITNVGKEPWTDDRGLLSEWVLGMFAPADDARIVIPFDTEASGPVVNDAYFGKVQGDRLKVKNGFVVFTADGLERGKIGLGPARAKSIAGSYSPSKGLLTIVQFNRSYQSTKYVNSMWAKQASPYGGDVINAYNDGPTGAGQPSLGGFYELESSSPALPLPPGGSATHVHRTYHFVGIPKSLDAIARATLGVSLEEIVK